MNAIRPTLVALVLAALTSVGAFGCANTHSTNTLTAPTQAKVATTKGVKGSDDASTQSEEVALIRQKLAAHRKQQIERLEAYTTAGKFPVNATDPQPLHQLKDENGVYCAVANLVVKDGLQDVIDREAQTNNALLFGDVKDGQLYSWILTSGLTQEEVAAIQAPAPYVGDKEINMPMPTPQPIDPPKQSQSIADLQKHFRAVEQQIVDDSDASLDVAASRLDETFGATALSLL